MSDPASAQGLEVCVSAKLPGANGQPYIVMFRTRVAPPDDGSIAVTLSHMAGEGAVTLAAGSPAHAEMLAFLASLWRCAVSLRCAPIRP